MSALRTSSLSVRARTKAGMTLAHSGSFGSAIRLMDVDAQWQHFEDALVHLATPESNLRSAATAASTPDVDSLPHYAEWRQLRGIPDDSSWPLKNQHRSWNLVPETPRQDGSEFEAENRNRYRDAKMMYLRLRTAAYVSYVSHMVWACADAKFSLPDFARMRRQRKFKLACAASWCDVEHAER